MSHIPPRVRAVLDALQFSNASQIALENFSDSDWTEALDFCDNARLTLALGQVSAAALPEWVRARVGRNLANNTERFERMKAAFRRVAARFRELEIEFLVLKGFAQCPQFVTDPRLRQHYDIDLYCPQSMIPRAQEVLRELGYTMDRGSEELPIDHLPTMRPESSWEWRGDFFDPEMPYPVELHFRFWDSSTERFGPRDLDVFWTRRVERQLEELRFHALHPADALGYAVLHILRHLFRGDLQICQVHELASFLDASASDPAFWREWQSLHDESLRRLEAICFHFAQSWFGCRLSIEAREEIERLTPDIHRWFKDYAIAPLEAEFSPNKHEMWLHMCLLESAGDRFAVLRRRLLPTQMRGHADEPAPEDARLPWAMRLRKRSRHYSFVLSRVSHHARALFPALWHGARWWWSGKELGANFWRFFAASSLFELGMYIFALLYNLYLLDRGYREDFLGLVTAAMTLGSIAGVIPAAFLAQRLGIRRTLLISLPTLALLLAARGLVQGRVLLLVSAFLSGTMFSAWEVAFVPAMAFLTSERVRPFGFSLTFASSVAIGILGGLAGGSLPRWMSAISGAPAAEAKQMALLAGCAIIAWGALPLLGLRFPKSEAPVARQKFYPRGPFVLRFLLVVGIWNLAAGAFAPFFNAYFSQYLRVPVERIGMIFSASQFSQVVAVLLAPAIFRRFGLVAGIAYTQIAAAFALAGLGAGLGSGAAAVVYGGYTSFLFMSAPGMNTLLMSRVTPEERTGASALNTLLIFASQAIAASAAGMAFTRFGYPPTLAVTAAVMLSGALLFRGLLAKFEAR